MEQEFLNCIDNDKVSTYIEDMVTTQRPLHSVLRLISLQSLVSSGLKERVLDHYKWEVFNGYGLEGMQGIIQVEKAGLISYQENQRTYSVLRKVSGVTYHFKTMILGDENSHEMFENNCFRSGKWSSDFFQLRLRSY